MKVLSILICLLIALPSFAGQRKRYKKQNARIAHGIKNDSLTKGETRRLRARQKQIRRVAKRAAADGEVTRREKKRIRKMQNRQNKRIRKFKHNDKNRGDNLDTSASE